MNSLGHVVGRLGFAGSPASDGFFYDGQSMVDLGTLGFGNAAAIAINDKDQIVGYASMADGRELATLFTTGKGFVALDKLVDELDDWQLNEALSINDHGVIIGIGTRRDGTHAFMLTPIAD